MPVSGVRNALAPLARVLLQPPKPVPRRLSRTVRDSSAACPGLNGGPVRSPPSLLVASSWSSPAVSRAATGGARRLAASVEAATSLRSTRSTRARSVETSATNPRMRRIQLDYAIDHRPCRPLRRIQRRLTVVDPSLPRGHSAGGVAVDKTGPICSGHAGGVGQGLWGIRHVRLRQGWPHPRLAGE